MGVKLKVGMKIPVYKILTDGGYGVETFTPGTFRVGRIDGFGLISNLVLKNKKNWLFPDKDDGYGVMSNNEAKLVGALRIKTLKNGTK